ncbi:MAG: hypothetical protein VX379_07475 [Pseudomonadota bacterium]|jgi:hypothetical protein|nr:hypothetical protein [Pseudomonadota bacterium]MEE3320311.1 hypothetical protein [Pseudomonadota bacterium]
MSIDLLIAALVLVAVQLRICAALLPMPARVILALVVFVWALLPYPWGPAAWVLSYLASFSVASGLLAILAIKHRITGFYWLPVSQLRGACVLLVGLALWFYPTSMGSTYLDPYALGYGNFTLSTILLLVGLLAWVLRAYASCLILVAAQVAFHLDLLDSDNLWDYLLDPWLVFWAAGWLIRDRVLRSRNGPDNQPARTA